MTETSKAPYFDLPAAPEQLEAVGRVAAAWFYLESIQEAAIWNLCMLEEPRVELQTNDAHQPANADRLVADLTPLSDNDEGARDLKRRRKQIEDLGRERNEIVHGLWVRGEYRSPMTLQIGIAGARRHA